MWFFWRGAELLFYYVDRETGKARDATSSRSHNKSAKEVRLKNHFRQAPDKQTLLQATTTHSRPGTKYKTQKCRVQNCHVRAQEKQNRKTLRGVNNPEYSLEELVLKLKLQYLVTCCEERTHWKRLWCWERVKARGEGGNRGWAGWMASLTQWAWVWANSGRYWRTGKPGVLQFTGSQIVEHDLEIEQWTTTKHGLNYGQRTSLSFFLWLSLEGSCSSGTDKRDWNYDRKPAIFLAQKQPQRTEPRATRTVGGEMVKGEKERQGQILCTISTPVSDGFLPHSIIRTKRSLS